MTEILHVFSPQYFLGERPPSFWNLLLLLSQIPIMWQSFGAIGRWISEIWLPKKTSAVKHKPVRNDGSGRPKLHKKCLQLGVRQTVYMTENGIKCTHNVLSAETLPRTRWGVFTAFP